MNTPDLSKDDLLIENRIYLVRGTQVMLDKDLAELYQVETRIFNQAVKRNQNRFPENFRFQLNAQEWDRLRSQSVISNTGRGGRRYLPFVFTEQGVAMLSAVLNSASAIAVSIQIMSAFAEMRKVLTQNQSLFGRMDRMELWQMEAGQKFDTLFKALENKESVPEKGLFFDGQLFDAHHLVSDLIRNAKKELILIDNYVDDQVLALFGKRAPNVAVTIYTRQISKALQIDLAKYLTQYPPITVKEFALSHDRFLIIDRKILYHFGASLKDLGKKWFAFSRMDDFCPIILNLLPD